MSDVQTFSPSFLNPSLKTYYRSAKLADAKRTEHSQVLKRDSLERKSGLSSTTASNDLTSLRHASSGTARSLKLTRPLRKLSSLVNAKLHPKHIQSLKTIESDPLRLRLSGATTTTLHFPASRTVFLTVPVSRSAPRRPKLKPVYSRQELKLDWKAPMKQMTDLDLCSLVTSKQSGRFKWSGLIKSSWI
jgi:hypothetical protein